MNSIPHGTKPNIFNEQTDEQGNVPSGTRHNIEKDKH